MPEFEEAVDALATFLLRASSDPIARRHFLEAMDADWRADVLSAFQALTFTSLSEGQHFTVATALRALALAFFDLGYKAREKLAHTEQEGGNHRDKLA